LTSRLKLGRLSSTPEKRRFTQVKRAGRLGLTSRRARIRSVINRESTGGTQYRLVLRGELSDRFAGEFEGMHMERVAGTTVLSGNIVDQTHLYGLLDRLPELGIELVSVAPVGDLTGGGGVG
jgi:hypothetical protein